MVAPPLRGINLDMGLAEVASECLAATKASALIAPAALSRTKLSQPTKSTESLHLDCAATGPTKGRLQSMGAGQWFSEQVSGAGGRVGGACCVASNGGGGTGARAAARSGAAWAMAPKLQEKRQAKARAWRTRGPLLLAVNFIVIAVRMNERNHPSPAARQPFAARQPASVGTNIILRSRRTRRPGPASGASRPRQPASQQAALCGHTSRAVDGKR